MWTVRKMQMNKFTHDYNTYMQREYAREKGIVFNEQTQPGFVDAEIHNDSRRLPFRVHISEFGHRTGFKACSGCRHLYIYGGGGNDISGSVDGEIYLACQHRLVDKVFRPRAGICTPEVCHFREEY